MTDNFVNALSFIPSFDITKLLWLNFVSVFERERVNRERERERERVSVRKRELFSK